MAKQRKSKQKEPIAKAGKILIATPFLNDYYFGRSVVILADHSTEGSFGLIMNKPLDMKFNEIVTGFPDFNAKVFLGGPVKSDNLYFIHTLGDQISDSVKIINGLYWGGDIDLVQDMIQTGMIQTDEIRFFLGYCGWSPDQLDRELEESSWVVSSLSGNQLMKQSPLGMWKNMVKKLGGDYLEWIHYPPDPSLN